MVAGTVLGTREHDNDAAVELGALRPADFQENEKKAPRI